MTHAAWWPACWSRRSFRSSRWLWLRCIFWCKRSPHHSIMRDSHSFPFTPMCPLPTNLFPIYFRRWRIHSRLSSFLQTLQRSYESQVTWLSLKKGHNHKASVISLTLTTVGWIELRRALDRWAQYHLIRSLIAIGVRSNEEWMQPQLHIGDFTIIVHSMYIYARYNGLRNKHNVYL